MKFQYRFALFLALTVAAILSYCVFASTTRIDWYAGDPPPPPQWARESSFWLIPALSLAACGVLLKPRPVWILPAWIVLFVIFISFVSDVAEWLWDFGIRWPFVFSDNANSAGNILLGHCLGPRLDAAIVSISLKYR